MKVLLVYPNVLGTTQVQLGLAMLSSILKNQGHDVELFDVTFILERGEEFVRLAFNNKIGEYKPDLIAISCRTMEYPFLCRLLEGVKKKAPVIVGGTHATIVPEEVIENENVDMVCIGEGEEAVSELVTKLEKKGDITNVKNIWVKKDGVVHKNELMPLIQDLDKLPYPDWGLFDKRHISTVGRFEDSRGCVYNCSFCNNYFMRQLYSQKGKYYRRKSTKRIIEEIKYFKERYNLEKVAFIDELFITDTNYLKEFCSVYKKEVDLPFECMTRPELVTEEKLRLIKEAGCCEIAVGVESGNDLYRNHILNKRISREQIINTFRTARRVGLVTCSFNIIGLPLETRESIFQTIELNKKAKAHIFQCTIYYPFKKTLLGDLCEKLGLIDKEKELRSHYKGTILKNPYLGEKELMGLFRTYLIYQRSPRIFYPLIKILERENRASIKISGFLNALIIQGFNKRLLSAVKKELQGWVKSAG